MHTQEHRVDCDEVQAPRLLEFTTLRETDIRVICRFRGGGLRLREGRAREPRHTKPGFLNPGTADILDQTVLCRVGPSGTL